MNRLTGAILTLAVAAVLRPLAVPAAQNQRDKAELALKVAMDKETVDGDLKAAIEQYRKIVATYRANRAVAAKALVRMGQCYEKLGDAEARKAYEQAIREFGDQKEAVATARARLAALEGKQPEKGVVARQLWAGVGFREYGSSISQDGRYVAFFDQESDTMRLHDLVTGDTRQVSNAQGAFWAVLISPDGKQIAYARRPPDPDKQDELYVIGVDGSNPRLLAGRENLRVLPQSWSPDGKHILASLYRKEREGQLVLVSVADGSLKVIGSSQVYLAQFSPDGRYIAYARFGKLPSSGLDIFVLHIADGRETPLVENPGYDGHPMWTPDGRHVLFISSRLGVRLGDLWSIRVTEGRPDGPPELVKESLGIARPMGFSRDGNFYYRTETEMRDIHVAEVDPQTGKLVSRPEQLIGRYINAGPAWSPDGQYLAYYSQRGAASGGEGALTIVIRSTKTGEERVLSPKSLSPYPSLSLSGLPMAVLCSSTSQRGASARSTYRPGKTAHCWNPQR